MIGDKFGRYTVVSNFFHKGRYRYVTCKCDCGTVKDVRWSSLIDGDSKSCGCLARELASQRRINAPKKTNRYDVVGDIAYGFDSKGNAFVIDAEDLEKCSLYCFHKTQYGYFVCHRGGGVVRIHRLITGCQEGFEVDHINGNKADNRKANLRICTDKENTRNRAFNLSCHKRKSGKWGISIKVDDKSIWLGEYATREEALAKKSAALDKFFGEFSPTNRIEVMGEDAKRDSKLNDVGI